MVALKAILALSSLVATSVGAVRRGSEQAAFQAAENKQWRCTPVTMLNTRAVGSMAVAKDGAWQGPKFPAENVNTANVEGALKYIITECIDKASIDPTICARKNWVAYIDFYTYTVCQPAAANWWFSSLRENGYGGQPAADYYGLGQYLTFDDGACDVGFSYCNYVNGRANAPKLGNWIGWQDVSEDPRNPTTGAYWYSFPGVCPEMNRTKGKTEECMKTNPGGRCPPGVTPDGVTCTYSYEFFGEIALDALVGISDMGYKNYTEFCKAKNVEFERASDYSFVQGLDFWKDPLNKTANAERVKKMLEFYANKTANPMNKPLPTPEELDAKNPPCYCNVPSCVNAPCKYDASQYCVRCKIGEPGCEVNPDPSKCKYGLPTVQTLSKVSVPTTAPPTKEAETSQTPETNAEVPSNNDGSQSANNNNKKSDAGRYDQQAVVFAVAGVAATLALWQ